MEKISALAVGTALGITLVFLSALCAVAFTLSPEATLDFFGAFAHGIDFTAIKSTAPISLGRSLYGALGLGIIGFVAGTIFGVTYNLVRSR